jgi:hypothetical protein
MHSSSNNGLERPDQDKPDMTVQFVVSDLAVDTAQGEAAAVLDPLWMLARQWQLGELAGEDNGSPVGARMVVEAGMLDRWQPGAGMGAATSRPYRAEQRPLEACVEAEYWDTGTHSHLRLAAEIGLNLQRLLTAASLAATASLLKGEFRLSRPAPAPASDLATERYLGIMAGRVIDGVALYRLLQPLHAKNRLADAFNQPPLSQATDDRQAILEQLKIWMNACAGRTALMLTTPELTGNAAAWQRDRMEYAYATSARLGDWEVTLAAREHFEGETDWYTYVFDPARTLGAQGTSERLTFTYLPTSVQFRGMPKPRFWEIEDASVNLPTLARHRTDAASRLFVDFALRYSNDWFSVPLPLPAGSVSRIREMFVTNTFGEHLAIRHADSGTDGEWKMFALAVVSSDSNTVADFEDAFPYRDVFVLPLTLGQVLEGAPVEQVRFARDEMANLGWALEGLVESASGHRVDRAEQYARSRPIASAPSADTVPRYRLGSSVPEHWVPLLPDRDDRTTRLMLKRGAAPRFDADGSIQAIEPVGRLLEPGKADLAFFDEEVPREGIVAIRRYRYARSADGHAVLWIGRQKRPAQGEASSGLRFDTVEPIPGG